MNSITQILLKSLRKIYSKLFVNQDLSKGSVPNYIIDAHVAIDNIRNTLNSNDPCMIARYGAFEGSVVLNYLGIINPQHSYLKYIKSECDQWWWNNNLLELFANNAGFFPLEKGGVEQYAKLMIEDSAELTIVGCFDGNDIAQRLSGYHKGCKYIRRRLLEPDFFTNDASNEWTACLKGKKVLVIHPFAETIRNQYKNRTKLFNDPNFLPEFELITIKAVQSIGGSNSKFDSWFDALQYMKNEMDKIDYDICIIGCGAYGFNLAAHSKRTGHKAIHLGGVTQLLFGIIGKRWEEDKDYANITNEYWVRPLDEDKPENALKVENGCYW